MPSRPYEFRDIEAFRRKLRSSRKRLRAHFDLEDNIAALVRGSVENNTFRGLRRGRHLGPAAAFRQWAYAKVSRSEFFRELLLCRTQAAYDRWLSGLSRDLRRSWHAEVGKPMPFGASRKLPNLFMKALARWSGFDYRARKRLILFLHVPLDSYSLVAVRNCVAFHGLRIPRSASMGYVKDEPMYRSLQHCFRQVTRPTGCPPIYADVLAWNLGHRVG
jgi:hypothetical protein